ncbi:hypothetical protein BATDEDRAFT_88934 [Batrachochytrium dendrobatidis JAM81]|uniref:Uncharacterized protein n=2 Tax=Batrachochytrium dendrobatidis TaxID=109871 RepID=F4P3B2_BATDJ|nr:uncharacterized protein BATDEDRAFT_88934 [Batrachochytrium dendrobatidis JAM81]EGF80185.1 hypothetical protein BATDEDRAFT_88934 [Batrachochytrium dendrobatidis JAM81]KAJ8326462.1 hypothetical protein O5D80_005210 [Batrachochytrium dendrobatidis]KAK5666750.1 hypothetical protein QVD99_006807 [Batrachochytrium dendrobatidis]OAJ41113.1 hypothetical protein BDEG_24757 [Batrachochytrium dendrobatidis JEL423]|eukprot:XP_006679202.1 hypothetical protein BATDEDRAFT_88934 [Batrachochytrium dendrobatidis JAM81]
MTDQPLSKTAEEAVDDNSSNTQSDSTKTLLTAEEKLNLRREARRNKILAGSSSRLGRITQTFKGVTNDSTTDAATNINSNDSEKTALDSIEFKADRLPKESPAITSTRLLSTAPPNAGLGTLYNRSTNQDISPDDVLQQLLSGSVSTGTHSVPSFDFQSVQTNSFGLNQEHTQQGAVTNAPAIKSIWPWLHTVCIVILALFALYGITESEGVSTEEDHIVNRDLTANACQTIAKLSFSQVIDLNTRLNNLLSNAIGNHRMSVWIMFLTIEMGLNLLRFIYQLAFTLPNSRPGAFPTEVTLILRQVFRANTPVLESFSSAVSEAMIIWRSFYDDVLLFVFVVGSGVATMVLCGDWICSS